MSHNLFSKDQKCRQLKVVVLTIVCFALISFLERPTYAVNKFEPTSGVIAEFAGKRGYKPSVIAWDNVVLGIGASEQKASLALEMAQDGAFIKQLAQAFGGIQYMSEKAVSFIENWEVESYRKTQI